MLRVNSSAFYVLTFSNRRSQKTLAMETTILHVQNILYIIFPQFGLIYSTREGNLMTFDLIIYYSRS